MQIITKDINRTWLDRIIAILRRSCLTATKAWARGRKIAGESSSKIIGHLIGYFKDDCSDQNMSPFVYKLRDPQDKMDYHKRRILELADGRSIKELVATVYYEDLANAGLGACIGLFETEYKNQTSEEVNQLIKEGYLYGDYRESRPIYNKAPLNTSGWIRAHKRVYRKLARANRLCDKFANSSANSKQTAVAQFLRSLTDIRISINSGNGTFTSKERKQIQEMITHIYNDFYAHAN